MKKSWVESSGNNRWKRTPEGIWRCALHGRILALRQDISTLYYQATCPANRAKRKSHADWDAETLAFVYHYLNLKPDLTALYKQWSQADANFRRKAPRFCGVRNLRQDAWEALVGFICSSNNNIIRISQMMDKLCQSYGVFLGHVDGVPFHDMPSAKILTDPAVEAHLRKLGFGYRAKYLHQTAVMISEKASPCWLDSLRNPEAPVLGQTAKDAGPMRPEGRAGYRAAHTELLTLQGVGPKVADCVCLMGLGWGESVPIDTHVWQIAQRDYKFGRGKHSSLTRATYDAIGDKFRSLWGKEAGWAHTVLFTADLRVFSDRVAIKLENQGVKEELVEPLLREIKQELEDEPSEPDRKVPDRVKEEPLMTGKRTEPQAVGRTSKRRKVR